LYKWDPQQERLTFFRSVWTQNNTAIRLFSTDGRTRLTISPLAELTKYVAITIADVAATAEGGAAVAGVLKGTDNNLTDVILTYNDQAKLTQMWQVEPYNHRAIAVGSDGSVYAFGDRNDVKTFGQEENNASLLIHYSKDGKVLREQLPLNLFEKGLDVISTNGTTGEHHLFFADGNLVLYVAPANEVFLFDPELRIKKRVPLRQMLNGLLHQTGSIGARLMEISFDGKDIYAQIVLWTAGEKPVMSVRLVAVDLRTQAWRLVGHDLFDRHPGRLLQVESDGNVLALRSGANDVMQLDWFRP